MGEVGCCGSELPYADTSRRAGVFVCGWVGVWGLLDEG